MSEEQAMRLMADVGPNAKDALDSWVALQWAEFWASTAMGVGTCGLIGVIVFVFVRAIRAEQKTN